MQKRPRIAYIDARACNTHGNTGVITWNFPSSTRLSRCRFPRGRRLASKGLIHWVMGIRKPPQHANGREGCGGRTPNRVFPLTTRNQMRRASAWRSKSPDVRGGSAAATRSTRRFLYTTRHFAQRPKRACCKRRVVKRNRSASRMTSGIPPVRMHGFASWSLIAQAMRSLRDAEDPDLRFPSSSMLGTAA